MAPIHDEASGVVDWNQIFQKLQLLYKGDFLDDQLLEDATEEVEDFAQQEAAPKIVVGLNEYDPSVTIPQIIAYLRDNDASRDAKWHRNFSLIKAYLREAYRQMVSGGIGFSDPKLRAALEDARVMAKVHQHWSNHAGKKTPWTTEILRGQTLQERLLTYPHAFPLPEPNRARSQYRPVKPMPRPHNTNTSLWNTSLKLLDSAGSHVPPLAEVDKYVESENKYFQIIREAAKASQEGRENQEDHSNWMNTRFDFDNVMYEHCIRSGPAETATNAPPPHDNWPTDAHGEGNPDGSKGRPFYIRRGWQRAALQQCLNLFTNHENRVINTPWRRPVLPYDPPLPLPKDIAYVPRIVDPSKVINEKRKDPFSWLHWSSQYTQIIDFLAGCQRRRYENQVWGDLSASALPVNFRGPRIYRGLAVHDQHWLKIGDYLDTLERLLNDAWGAAPRPLLRAILRDIDAGRQDDTGRRHIGSNQSLGDEDDDLQDRKLFWRRDIMRRIGIDNREDDGSEDDYKLVDEFDIAWLRYLCESSRTLEMCDPSKLPSHNLAILFDAKLQSYFRDLEISGTLDSGTLNIWGESSDDIERVIRNHTPTPLPTVLAYINGCKKSELKQSGETKPNPEQPNGSYQFSIEEADFMCIELQLLGRCVFIPARDGQPAKVGRPVYKVHPEDRVLWRYEDVLQFQELNEDYLDDMTDHYDSKYGHWAQYNGNRLGFFRELRYMLDHTGPGFPSELSYVEIREKDSSASDASNKRREFIRENLVPEGLCHIGDLMPDSIETEREAPYQEDLATWEAVGSHLTKYREKKGQKSVDYLYSGNAFPAQTPEKTVQFFRNLAYRMGRTIRYVSRIRERLQYLEEHGTEVRVPKRPLDLSENLKDPAHEDDLSMNDVQTPVVEKWWHAVPAKDYNLAIEQWSAAIQEGSGEVTLLPPRIEEVLAKADPLSSFRHPLKEEQDPYTVIREGIIDDCFQNRPTMYPGRLSGFKDQEDKEFQGFERPNLFEWATKDQRRYQAPHTRQHFFNMQRWPPCRILPDRLDAIENREDERLRADPSKRDQTHGILTYRLPVGEEKPRYAYPFIDHGRDGRHWEDHNIYSAPQGPQEVDSDIEEKLAALLPSSANVSKPTAVDDNVNVSSANAHDNNATVSANVSGNANASIRGNGNSNDEYARYTVGNIGTFQYVNADNNVNVNSNANVNSHDNVNSHANGISNVKTNKNVNMSSKQSKGSRFNNGEPRGALIPFQRSDERFAPGPALFPMGDTLLQKLLISHELSEALYPDVPFYKDRLLGLPKMWHMLTGAKAPLIPLVPPVARSNIPRSNPGKRKMPIEFLNGSAPAKRFRSDASVPPRPGGIGGQFAAAVGISSTKAEAQTTRGNTTRRTGGGTTGTTHQQEEATTSLPSALAPSLRVYPDPSYRQARNIFLRDFASGWLTTKLELQYLYSSGLIALEFSIQRQLTKYGLKTSYQDLVKLSNSPECAALAPYVKYGVRDNFDIHCMSLLLQTWGEKHGMKLQLGVVQLAPSNNAGSAGQMPSSSGSNDTYVPYLVGSKYNSVRDKIVVWIRLMHLDKYPGSMINPYNDQPYNSYAGIGPSEQKRTQQPQVETEPES
ncbi:hypothetical protein GGS21DRAFT_549030 [Xylaria nigripes]|nr:hypothetical protein GGS21DRAFT_549030 [Xylaria nigripes]